MGSAESFVVCGCNHVSIGITDDAADHRIGFDLTMAANCGSNREIKTLLVEIGGVHVDHAIRQAWTLSQVHA